MMGKLTSVVTQLYYGDEEARGAEADGDHDRFDANIQGEGYGVLGDDKDMSSNSPPRTDSKPPIDVQHQREDPLTAGKPSPVVFAGSKPFEAKAEDVGEVFPSSLGYRNVEDQQDDSVRAGPPSGYGGQPDEVPKLKDIKGYPSLGTEESQDSENSTGVLSEEGVKSVKEREGSAPYYESMAKEREDFPVEVGSIADVPPSKKEFVDFLEGDADELTRREAVPQGFLRNAEWQQEDREGGTQGNLGKAPQEREERKGGPQKNLGIDKDEPVETEGGVSYQPAMAEEPEGGSAIEARGNGDVQSLKEDHVDIFEASSQEPKVVNDSMEGGNKYEPKADEPISVEAGHADASHFISQIKSPLDDPKQRYAVDDPIQELSVDDTKQEFQMPDSSKEEAFRELSQGLQIDDPREEKASISDPKHECPVDLKQGDSLDDLYQKESLEDKEKSPVDCMPKDGIAGLIHATDKMGEREAAFQAGRRDSFGNTQEQEERDVTSPRALETKEVEEAERKGASHGHLTFAEEREGGSATGSRGVIDVQSLKKDYVDLSEAGDHMGSNSTHESIPHQSAIPSEKSEKGYAPELRGILGVDSSEASTKERNLVGDSMDQSAIGEEREGDSAPGSRGIIDVQSLKEDYVDLSEADTKEPSPADNSMEGSIMDEPTPHQSAMTVEPEDGFGTESRGIMDVEDASLGDNALNVPAKEVTRDFTVDEREQDGLAGAAKPESAVDVEQAKEAQTSPADDDACGREHLQGDGKEKIKAEGYNIYSGESETAIYDAAGVIGDEHEKPRDETEAHAAVKPCEENFSAKGEALPKALGNMEDAREGSGFDIQGNEKDRDFGTRGEYAEPTEPFTQHVSSAALEQDVGFRPDTRHIALEDVSMHEDVHGADKKSPYTDVFKIDSSDIQQGTGFEPDLKDKGDDLVAINKEVDAADGGNGENGTSGEEVFNTEFAHTNEHVKVGHGVESSVPREYEEVDMELDQQEESRLTDVHLLDKPLELNNVAEQEETHKVQVPTRSPCLFHPQPEDLAEIVNNKPGGVGDDEQLHHEAGPQKMGFVAKIKEKLSPTSASH